MKNSYKPILTAVNFWNFWETSALGLLGILIHAKKTGLIPLVKPLIDQLRNYAGFWIDNKLYQYILDSVNE